LRPIKIGIIGAGGIASHHVKAFEHMSHVQVASVFDISTDQAAKMAERTGAAIAASADELLDPRSIDAVVICSPQFARGQLEELAASRRIHMLVEKPLGLQMEEVMRKEQAIRESGVIHSAGYCLRYLDTVQMARQYLQGKPVHLVQVHRYGTAHPAKWWNQLSMSGGFLVDAVTHQVDLVRYLIGEFAQVYASFGRNSIREINPEATIYDSGALTFTMANGAVGTLTESCLSPHHSGSEIKIFGPDYYLALSRNGSQITIVDEVQNVTKTTKMDAYFEQDKQFAQAVAANCSESILSSYGDAARTLAFTLAANRSFIEQQSVRLDEAW